MPRVANLPKLRQLLHDTLPGSGVTKTRLCHRMRQRCPQYWAGVRVPDVPPWPHRYNPGPYCAWGECVSDSRRDWERADRSTETWTVRLPSSPQGDRDRCASRRRRDLHLNTARIRCLGGQLEAATCAGFTRRRKAPAERSSPALGEAAFRHGNQLARRAYASTLAGHPLPG